MNINDPLPDRISHMKAEKKEGDKIEEGSPDHCMLRRKNAGGNDSRNGVCGVMKSVQKIEREREQDKKNDPGGHSGSSLRRV
jgi:hypothetical protein